MLQTTGAPRAVAARLREARGSSADSANRDSNLGQGVAESMRLCWFLVALLVVVGAAGKAGSRRPRGVGVSPPNSGSPVGNLGGGN